jgi:hypothetical protein
VEARPSSPSLLTRIRRARTVRVGALTAAAVLAAAGASAAQQNTVTTGTGYLGDRAAFLTPATTSCGPNTQARLSMSVTWLNGANGVVGYGYAYSVSYYPQTWLLLDGVLVTVPPHFTADHVAMEFSDRANFAPARADDIGFDISWTSGGATVTETLHSWGDGKVKFPVTGANDGVLYGDDASTAHTAVALVKQCDVIPG